MIKHNPWHRVVDLKTCMEFMESEKNSVTHIDFIFDYFKFNNVKLAQLVKRPVEEGE